MLKLNKTCSIKCTFNNFRENVSTSEKYILRKDKIHVHQHFLYIYIFYTYISCDYLKQISIKTSVVTDEGNGRNEIWH